MKFNATETLNFGLEDNARSSLNENEYINWLSMEEGFSANEEIFIEWIGRGYILANRTDNENVLLIFQWSKMYTVLTGDADLFLLQTKLI